MYTIFGTLPSHVSCVLIGSSTKSSHMKVSKSCSPIKCIESIDSVIVGVGQTLLQNINKAYQTALVCLWFVLGLLAPDIGT